jgi:hypothetical protein
LPSWLGDWDEALTFGKVVAGLNARPKSRVLGILSSHEEKAKNGGRSSLHLVGSAFAIEKMSRFSGAFSFTSHWFFATTDERANLIATDSLLFGRNNFFLSISHFQTPLKIIFAVNIQIEG